MEEPRHSQWQGHTDGTPFMHRALVTMFKVVPLEAVYAVMALVVPFYMLFSRKSFMAIYHFFRRRLGKGCAAAVWHTYRNHLAFGQVVLDRFASYAGRSFHVTIDGNDHFRHLTSLPGGFLMLSAHAGSYEQAGYALRSDRKPIYALTYMGESEVVMTGRRRQFADKQIRLIPVRGDMSHLFELNRVLDQGGIVSIPADRRYGSEKSVACRFFGAEARFPLGPFATAVQKEVPAVAVVVMKERTRSFRATVTPLHDDPSLPRRDRMQHLAQAYADALEKALRKHPHQWYNYYEFWDNASA